MILLIDGIILKDAAAKIPSVVMISSLSKFIFIIITINPKTEITVIYSR